MNISNFTEVKHNGVVIYCYYGKPLEGKYGVESEGEEYLFDTLEEAKQFIEGEKWKLKSTTQAKYLYSREMNKNTKSLKRIT